MVVSIRSASWAIVSTAHAIFAAVVNAARWRVWPVVWVMSHSGLAFGFEDFMFRERVSIGYHAAAAAGVVPDGEA